MADVHDTSGTCFESENHQEVMSQLLKDTSSDIEILLETKGNISVSNESFIDNCFNNIYDKSELSCLQEDYIDFKKCVFHRLTSIEESLLGLSVHDMKVNRNVESVFGEDLVDYEKYLRPKSWKSCKK